MSPRAKHHGKCFFRPPGGHLNNVSAVSKSLGMQTVLWSVDTQDWSQPRYLSKSAQDAIVRKGTDLRYSNVNTAPCRGWRGCCVPDRPGTSGGARPHSPDAEVPQQILRRRASSALVWRCA